VWRRLIGVDRGDRPLSRPFGIAWDGDDVVLSDPGAGSILRIDQRGRIRARTREGFLASPIGVAVCGGEILVSDSRRGSVFAYALDLTARREIAQDLARPTGVACSGQTAYVVETAAHRVLELNLGTGARRTVGHRGSSPGEFNFPTAIALDGAFILVGDTLNFRIQRISIANGEHLGSFGRLGDAPGETPRVKGLAVDSQHRVWVSDSLLDQIAIFAPDGELLGDFGGPGGASGEFAFPAGIAARSDGRVAIVDSLNRRVQVVRLDDHGDVPGLVKDE